MARQRSPRSKAGAGQPQSREHAALGRAVRETRARHALSQEDLGFESGLHRNYVGAIERGEINPTFRVLLQLSRGLRIKLSELLTLSEQHYREIRPTKQSRARPTRRGGRS